MTERCSFVDPKSGERCGREESRDTHRCEGDPHTPRMYCHPFQPSPSSSPEPGCHGLRPLRSCTDCGNSACKRNFVQDDEDSRSWGECNDSWHNQGDRERVSSPKPEHLWSECPRCDDGLYNGKACAICWGTGRITELLLNATEAKPPMLEITAHRVADQTPVELELNRIEYVTEAKGEPSNSDVCEACGLPKSKCLWLRHWFLCDIPEKLVRNTSKGGEHEHHE